MDNLKSEVTNSKTAIFYSEKFLKHKAPLHHPENEKRLLTTMNSLKNVNFFNARVIEPREASFEELRLVHTKKHIELIEKASTNSQYLDPDTYTSPNSFKTAKMAVGSVIQAIELITKNELSKAFCLVRPPGHHASANQAMGFCLFNNVAVGAAWLVCNHNKKVAILDFDAHHGNGTQSIFFESDKVIYCSWHQWPHYPGTGWLDETGQGSGQGYTVNIPLPKESSDDILMSSLNEIVIPVLKQFEPSLIIVSAGFDSHKNDPLSSLLFTEDGYAAFTSQLIKQTENITNGIIYCLEGGYNLNSLQKSVLKSFRVLADKGVKTTLNTSKPKKTILIDSVKETVKKFWNLNK